jgi:hypothetical protein
MSDSLCPLCNHAAVLRRIVFDYRCDCSVCSVYFICDDFVEDLNKSSGWTLYHKAALSFFVKNGQNLPTFEGGKYPYLSYVICDALRSAGKLNLPYPSEQLARAIKFFGDYQRENGRSYPLLREDLAPKLGVFGMIGLIDLVRVLTEKGLLECHLHGAAGTVQGKSIVIPTNIGLSFEGWEEWEAYKTGRGINRDGFVAMQFGDDRLDKFISDIVRPGIKERLALNVYRVDSPSNTKAGLIDNIMREAIENAAFVLVELSHGNKGAYWEAGLAEGLRKPVIYLCEQSVWDDPTTRPHFDVNHRTTIMWDEADPKTFLDALCATISNSLRQHSNEF